MRKKTEKKENNEVKEKKSTKKKTKKKITRFVRRKKKEKNNESFKLSHVWELLGIILVIALIVVIACFTINSYIANTKKNEYIKTVKDVISDAQDKISTTKMEMYDLNTTYYIPLSCIEENKETPYGNFTEAYVVVTFNGSEYDYYWTGTDSANYGIKNIVASDKLSSKDVESGIRTEDIIINVGIDGRESVTVYNKTCSGKTITAASVKIDTLTGKEEVSKVANVLNQAVKGKLSVGDEVVVGENEHFYVVSTNSEKTTLIAKYNLYVGNIIKYTDGKYSLVSRISEDDPKYGLQSSQALGYNGSWVVESVGVVPFSGNTYWLESPNQLLSKYNNESKIFPLNVYVYDKNISNTGDTVACGNGKCKSTNNEYSISYYVQQYANKLRQVGLYIYEARLISSEELEKLGCVINNPGVCSGREVKDFVKTVSYWSGTLYDYDSIRPIDASNATYLSEDYDTASRYGVRPVIVVRTPSITF